MGVPIRGAVEFLRASVKKMSQQWVLHADNFHCISSVWRLLFELVQFLKGAFNPAQQWWECIFHPELYGLESGVTGFTTSL